MATKRMNGARTLFVGVDGGGTKTTVSIGVSNPAEKCEVLGTATRSGSNPLSKGIAESTAVIAETVRAALSKADFRSDDQVLARVAIAGAQNAEVRRQLEEQLTSDLQLVECEVVGDLEPLIVAAEDIAKTGIGLVVGTGSAVGLRDEKGQLRIMGGWGALLGDDGSGFSIGREALRHTLLQCETTNRIDSLAFEILNAVEVDSALDLKREIYSSTDPRQAVASLAPLVLHSAEGGNSVAGSIRHGAIVELVKLIERAVTSANGKCEGSAVRAAGGLLRNEPFLQELKTELAARAPGLNFQCIQDVGLLCMHQCYGFSNREDAK